MNVHPSWSHQTELAAEASSVSRARTFVVGHLLDHGLAHLVDAIELVVSELATNALVHTGSPFTVTWGPPTGPSSWRSWTGRMSDRPS